MSLSRLPSGRWRARVWSAGKEIPVGPVLGLPAGTTWDTKREAKAAREQARAVLRGGSPSETTVGQWWDRWTTDKLFRRPKESTNIHNRERTKAFVEAHRNLPMWRINDLIVGQWLAGGMRNGTVPALRVMFNDAMTPQGGRLIDRNPFARLGISKGTGNRDVTPPDESVVLQLIDKAFEQGGPSFRAWIQVAAFTGMRPGELDALRWSAIDYERSRILVAEQFSSTSNNFTLPKNGRRRFAPLTPPAREALLALPDDSDFCFVNLRGDHFTASSRAYHWKATRAAVGYTGTLYLATRHFAGSYMINVLGMPSEDVAIALGHEDGGELIRRLYGHRDKDLALDRVVRAYENRENVRQLPVRREETG